jgi:hypothetical protein
MRRKEYEIIVVQSNISLMFSAITVASLICVILCRKVQDAEI